MYFVGTNGQASIGRKHSGLSCSNVPPLTNAPPPISSSTPDRRFPYSGMAERVFVGYGSENLGLGLPRPWQPESPGFFLPSPVLMGESLPPLIVLRLEENTPRWLTRL